MILIDEWKTAFGIMLHPYRNTKKSMSTSDALKFYYKLSIIPGILTVIISIISYMHPSVSLLSVPGYLKFFFLIMGVLSVWILTPVIGLLALNAWFQLIGKLVRRFTKPYSNTLTAAVYAIIPNLLVVWVSGLTTLIINPLHIFTLSYFLMLLVTLPFSIWSIIIWLYAMSNQQRISKLAAFGVDVLSSIILGALIFIVAFLLAIVWIVLAAASL